MAGLLYPYTPAYSRGQVASPGEAFEAGFRGGQEAELRALGMDANRQRMKLAGLQEQRQAELFPLERDTKQQALRHSMALSPLQLEQTRLANQQTQANMANTAQQRAAADALARFYQREGGSTGAMPPPVTPTPSAPTPGTRTGPGLMDPVAPAGTSAPAPTVGPQSSAAPAWLNNPDQFGERRFTGTQIASAGTNDFTGLPTGMSPAQAGGAPRPVESLSSDELSRYLDLARQRERFGIPTTARGAPPYSIEELTQQQLIRDAIDSLDRGRTNQPYIPAQDSLPGSLAAQPYPGVPTATPATTAPPTTTPAAPAGGFTEAEVRAATEGRGDQVETPVGIRPQGAPTQRQVSAELERRITQLTQTTPDPLSVMDPYRVGVERRALDVQERALEVDMRRINSMRQEATLLARSNPAAAITLMNNVRAAEAEIESKRSALALSRANLNGRINISEFAAGNFAPLANDIYQASNGMLRLQPITGTNRFNIVGPDGNVRGTRTREELIADGRQLYDSNYQTQMAAIREQATARRNAMFKAYTDGFTEALKNDSATDRDIAIKRAEEKAKLDFRGSNIETKTDLTGNHPTITFTDRNGLLPPRVFTLVPRRDMRGNQIPGWAMEELSTQPRPTR
jgi:hypothetical protein